MIQRAGIEDLYDPIDRMVEANKTAPQVVEHLTEPNQHQLLRS